MNEIILRSPVRVISHQGEGFDTTALRTAGEIRQDHVGYGARDYVLQVDAAVLDREADDFISTRPDVLRIPRENVAGLVLTHEQ